MLPDAVLHLAPYTRPRCPPTRPYFPGIDIFPHIVREFTRYNLSSAQLINAAPGILSTPTTCADVFRAIYRANPPYPAPNSNTAFACG